MPVRVGIMCEKCERIYLLVHPDNAQRIQFDPHSEPHPYRLMCLCRAERHFDQAQLVPYMVSERVCDDGYADRDEYYSVPKQSNDDYIEAKNSVNPCRLTGSFDNKMKLRAESTGFRRLAVPDPRGNRDDRVK